MADGYGWFFRRSATGPPSSRGEGQTPYDATMTFNGLKVYGVTAAAGFTAHGGIPSRLGEGGSCQNWWTRGASQVKRSVFMEDYVYSIASDEINVSHLSNLADPLTRLTLTP